MRWVISRPKVCVCVCVCTPYMGVFVEEVETVLIDSNDTGSVKGGGAAAVDVEERRAEHGECTDQAWKRTRKIWVNFQSWGEAVEF